MKAEDFRKGNLVMDAVSGTYMVIDEIGENIGAVLLDRGKYPLPAGWQMNPIPLTSEILEKCGFVGGSFKTIGHLTFTWFAPDNLNIRGMLGSIKPSECKYLHQLQNAVYFLTGEELKIQL